MGTMAKNSLKRLKKYTHGSYNICYIGGVLRHIYTHQNKFP